MGDIVVGEKGDAECLVLSNPELVFKLYERRMLADLLRHEYETVISWLQTKKPHLAAAAAAAEVGVLQ